jgi:hypothetical protein
MTLILAVHTVETKTAKVSFSMIQLNDFIKTKALPGGFKCWKTFPTSGTISSSVWDVDLAEKDPSMDAEEADEHAVALLVSWLTENLDTGDMSHECYVIQEAFAHGLGDIQRSRATERAVTSTTKAVKDLDTKMRITERTTSAVGAVKDSELVQQTGAAISKAGNTVYTAGVSGVANARAKFGELFGGKKAADESTDP